MGFRRDLMLGNIGQDLVVQIFNDADIPAYPNEDRKKLPDYDIIIPFAKKNWTAEVKYDMYAQRSGNVAIEYFNPKTMKASGIMSTKADFWIHVLTNPDKAFIITTDKLKDFISKEKPHKTIDRGGDGNASLLLYRVENIMDNAMLHITPKTVKPVLELIINGK